MQKKRNNDRVQETICTSIAMQSYHGKELEIQMMVLSVKWRTQTHDQHN